MVFLRTIFLRAALSFGAVLVLMGAAAAGPPDCPCWNQDRSLMARVMELVAREGDILSCDQVPNEESKGRRITQSVVIAGLNYEFEAAQEFGPGGPSEATCTVFIIDRVMVNPLKKKQFWRCAEDITELCRQLADPSAEDAGEE